MKLHVLLAIGLAVGLIVSTFAQQKEPSPSEQDGAQAALQAAVDATAKKLLVPEAMVILSTQDEFTVCYGTTTLGAAIPAHGPTPTSESP